MQQQKSLVTRNWRLFYKLEFIPRYLNFLSENLFESRFRIKLFQLPTIYECRWKSARPF